MADLQKKELLVKTDPAAAGKSFALYFDNYKGLSGGVWIDFWKWSEPNIRYSLTLCDFEFKPFPVTPPVKEGEENIWGFQKIGTEFRITCNGEVVLRKNISPSSCEVNKWERDVRSVEFRRGFEGTVGAQFRLRTPGLYLFTCKNGTPSCYMYFEFWRAMAKIQIFHGQDG